MLAKCNAIHKTIVEQFKHAIVYGQSVKHQPQRVGLTHELADEDISELWLPLALLSRFELLSMTSHYNQTVILQKSRRNAKPSNAAVDLLNLILAAGACGGIQTFGISRRLTSS